MTDPRVIGDLDRLLAAGKTLATLAEPGRDLDALGGDMIEIAETLRSLGRGMQHAYERAEATYDGRCDSLSKGQLWSLAERREWTRDEIALARDNELKAARDTALRTAKRALVSLAALVADVEREAANG